MNNDIQNIAEAYLAENQYDGKFNPSFYEKDADAVQAEYQTMRGNRIRKRDHAKSNIRDLANATKGGSLITKNRERFEEWLHGKDGALLVHALATHNGNLTDTQKGRDLLFRVWVAGSKYGVKSY